MAANQKQDFEFPEVVPGDRVLVWADPSMSAQSGSLGIVTQVVGEAADIWVIGAGGTRIFESCLYADDPCVSKFPGRFEDGQSGVFRLADSTIRSRESLTRLEAIEKELEVVAADVARLKRDAGTKQGKPT